jgi:PAS domain S-box-containing protein
MIDTPGDWAADESEGLYESLFDLSPLPTVVHDGRTVLRGNPAAAATFGYESAEELVGAALIAHVHPDSVPAVVERTTAMLRGENVPPLVERFLRKDGSDFVGETFASPIRWHGQPAIHVIVRDLTEVRETEAELRRSEDSYRQLFELAPDPIIVHDGETALLYNHAAAEFLSLADATGSENSIWSVVPEDQRERVALRMQEMARTNEPAAAIELTLRVLNGELRQAEVTSARTWWHGSPAVVTVFRDLTERRLAETALHDVEERYAAVVEQAPMGMHFYRLDSREQLIFTGANKAAGDILGVDHRPLVGLPIEEAWPGLADTEVPQRYRTVAREGGQWEQQSISYDDGTVSGAFETHAFSIGPRACVAMFWDITERVRNETELDQYRLRLEELVAERTQALDQAQRDVEAVTAVAALAVELRDPYTAGHQRRVAQLSHSIALELKLDDTTAERVRIAGKLHDIGKLSIPAEILSKPGKLSPVEYELVKGHATAACDILNGADIGWPLAEMVSQHHERMDGSGYPAGLLGEDIMMEARILAVADVVEAMSSHRPYRASLGMPAAVEEIQRLSGTCFDEDVVAACVSVINSGFEFADSSDGVRRAGY